MSETSNSATVGERKLSEEELKQQRATTKGSLTRIFNFSRDFKGTDFEQITIRNKKLEELWVKYDSIQTQLEFLNISEHEPDRDIFETSYYNAKGLIERILSKSSAFPSTNSITQPEAAQGKIKDSLKLPQINIPTFSGDYQSWQGFSDIFDSLVHANKELSNIQKFFYLKSQLRGEALQIIESITVSSENYEEAWKLLTERYNNRQFIVNTHLQSLFEISCISRDSLSSLRHLITDAKQHLRSLKSLGLPTEYWDDLIVYMLSQKLDHQCRREWELSKSSNTQELPKLDEFFAFLEKRCFSLEAMKPKITNNISFDKQKQKSLQSYTSSQQRPSDTNTTCKLCKGSHTLPKCETFLKQTPSERSNTVKNLNLCFNCLRGGHPVTQCKSIYSCRHCRKNHNSLLHIERQHVSSIVKIPPSGGVSGQEEKQPASAATSTNSQHSFTLQNLRGPSEILLATAVIQVKDAVGRWQNCRVLLDSGSQTHFVTTRLIKRLGIMTTRKYIPIGGIAQVRTEVSKAAQLHISSRFTNYHQQLEFLVLENITNQLPTMKIKCDTWDLPRDIMYADPNFNMPGEIEMLLGAEIFLSILKDPKFRIPATELIIQNTEFGCIISGKIEHCFSTINQQYSFLATESLNSQIRKFWEIEDNYSNEKIMSDEEYGCEQHFVKNTTRDETGRYIVKLPFKSEPSTLGDSHTSALLRYNVLEKKFKRNYCYKTQYNNFLSEYEELGHMKEESCTETFTGYYMPHHAVFKPESVSTKIRVVFDASATSSSGVSLNNILMVGPTVQNNVFTILLRFRVHAFVFTADIEKMYRQIKIHTEDTKYQRILWRPKETDEVKIFELQTVTYGTASAPYLAIRCLHQLAEDEKKRYPTASNVVKSDFYVDDLLTGSSSIKEAIILRDHIISLLRAGGFTLRKWSSNDSRILRDLNDRCEDPLRQLNMQQTIKTLGLQWNASNDIIVYNIIYSKHKHLTKRVLLSQIAKLFDPLGLVAPVICKSKILMQKIWQSKLESDDPVTEEIAETWKKLQSQLHILQQLRIPRRITANDPVEFQFHGFCDASESAFGACLYLRTSNQQGNVVQLVCSKSRVAPLKKVTLPRFELCAAVLLANLLSTTLQALPITINNIYLWSDSTITIAWIQTPAFKLKTFVANRVAEIQKKTKKENWRWISTHDNPADLVSRGCYPENLINNEKWWRGPYWLTLNEVEWSRDNNESQELPEEVFEYKNLEPTSFVAMEQLSLFQKFSKLIKLQRTMAYCLRFVKNTRTKDKIRGPLTVTELKHALTRLIKQAQREEFREEVTCLEKTKQIRSKSKLISLTPFLDQEGILRIRGRIENANVPYHQKHPIILPANHILTKLILEQEHIKLLHAGTHTLLNHIRQEYWPINGRNQIKNIIHNCIKCYRARLAQRQHRQLMGDLPKCRFETIRAFFNVGVDYGGPLLIRTNKLRKSSTTKAYIALFICMSTKAIHLELVSGLSTPDFLAAFKRFVARRGYPANMYSDNGGNFKGASKELRELQEFLSKKENQETIANLTSRDFIQWHFIPPNSPNFGGLWEAGIKSVKNHIKRVIGEAKLTFEEMYTLLTHIESCVNSRPLTPIYDDPADFTALTPGHFLIGAPLTQVPEHRLTDVKINTLTRWQLIQQMSQHFWDKWSSEYLHHLQQRVKWNKIAPNLKIGDMVVVKDAQSTPLQWKLARVIQCHPGNDNKVRVVTIRTSAGEFKRSISSISPLPASVC